jgi:hypothetical protein
MSIALRGWTVEIVQRGALVALYQTTSREGLLDYVRGWCRPAKLTGPVSVVLKGPYGLREVHEIRPERSLTGRLRVPRQSVPRREAERDVEPRLDVIPLDESGWYRVPKP